jgi:predicted Zn-dependent protease
LIDKLEKQSGVDHVTRHLRGVAFMGMADKGKELTAAQEFQAALRIRRNWESLYALGVTLTRAGKLEQVAPIIKDLDKMITTNGQRYWVEMLKAEWYIEKSKYLNAQKILTDWQKREASYVVPRQLLMKLYKKTGKQDEGMAVENELVQLAKVQRPGATFEGFASPLGVMALANRPLD